MISFDQQYSSLSKVLTYKQINLPRIKEFKFRNYSTFDIFVTLPNKKRLWEKWSVFIPTLETKRHYVFYNNKANKII